MSIEKSLHDRSGNKCELCTAEDSLSAYEVPPVEVGSDEKAVLLCATCKDQIEGTQPLDQNHWRCLNDSMWSSYPAVQVMAWRVLSRLDSETWAQDLLDMFYLDEEILAWAESGLPETDNEDVIPTLDSNGTRLAEGDTVTLIKDLDVKGGGFTAKRGTTVKNISLTHNPEHIEGKVNGVRIVLVSNFLKKA